MSNPFEKAAIMRVNTRYLDDPDQEPVIVPEAPRAGDPLFDYGESEVPPGLHVEAELLFIQSPKGTGKTEYLARRVPHLLKLGLRVLLIGNRRTLLAALASRVGLTNYLRDDMRSYNVPHKGFAICLDSLWRVKPGEHDYDVVIIDESQGVLSHLRADTLAKDRRKIMDYLRYHLRKAKQVILLDADLGKLTLDVVAEIYADRHRSSKFVINEWKPSGKTVFLYDDRRSPRQAVGDLVLALRGGRRCYVACNSKADAQLLAAEIPRHVARDLRVLCVTGDNSKEPAIQRFIRNIKEEILSYDLVIVSPAVASGVDIRFPDDAALIHEVFGIMRPLVTTHFEIDQQLARVRNPECVRVWISDEEFLFECDPEVIRAEIWASEAEHHVWLGTDDSGEDKYLPDVLNDTVFVAVAAQERASKNALRKNYAAYKATKGWTVTSIPLDPDSAALGTEVLKEGKEAQEAVHVAVLLSARKLTEPEYLELRFRGKVGMLEPGDEPAMRRYELEAFYRTEISPALIHFDDKGRGRRAVRNMEALLATATEGVASDAAEAKRLKRDQFQWSSRREVLSRVLTAAGLLGPEGFRLDSTVNMGALGRFVTEVESANTRAMLQRLFDLVPRKDHVRKPVLQLRAVLKLVGLSLVNASRDRKRGADVVSYQLDPSSVEVVLEHVNRRKKIPGPEGGEPDHAE